MRVAASLPVLCLVLACLCAACSNPSVKGDGIRTEVAYRTIDFQTLEVRGPVKTSFIINEQTNRVHDLAISGDANLIPKVQLQSRQGRLLISTTGDKPLAPVMGLHVEGRPSAMRDVKLYDSSSAFVRGAAAEELTIHSESESSFTFEGLSSDRVYVEVFDRARGGLHGATRELLIVASKKTKIDARNLEADIVNVRASGIAEVFVCANKTLNVVATGHARVIYSCGPEEIHKDTGNNADVRSYQDVVLEEKEIERRKRVEAKELREARQKAREQRKEAKRKKEAAEAAKDDDE